MRLSDEGDFFWEKRGVGGGVLSSERERLCALRRTDILLLMRLEI